ncbi:hypothetical protein ASPSYDRAFT_31746 [Aspergillus sydowii CBS 593.65]|uniref:Uncharacterized protein n=1 Tax=Aspergillus sydowii CBS 593.65 TaxID=1036612 RepID=A0A1L9TIC6_9EURO|nr:uncharacterized protein ASPSYDRAFT_31746 [Aspergillus sydowii CBS 593.65]OJJ59131.1 hypothetical protein ASPSYDRAFT_31746 [Aspergillus sydowii CBS 593.65]
MDCLDMEDSIRVLPFSHSAHCALDDGACPMVLPSRMLNSYPMPTRQVSIVCQFATQQRRARDLDAVILPAATVASVAQEPCSHAVKPQLPEDTTQPESGFFRDYEINLIISIAVKVSDRCNLSNTARSTLFGFLTVPNPNTHWHQNAPT